MSELAIRERWAEAYRSVVLALDRSRGGRFVLDILRGIGTVLHHLRSEPVFERAAALSYGTILSLVPLLGVVLGIVGAVGESMLRERVHDAIFTFLAPGVRAASQAYLQQMLDRATSNGVLSVSGGALVFTSVMLMRSVEETLNDIWGVENRRPLWIRIPFFLLLLVIGPVLLGVSLAATAALRHQVFEQLPYGDLMLALAPIAASIFGLTLLYWLAPHAEVRKRAAFAGAIVAGLAFEVAKHGYAVYTSVFVHYNMIYGSLGAIPLFLVWVYLSWVILLFGARLAYAVQNARTRGYAALPPGESVRARLTARTMLAASVAAVSGRPAPSVHTIAHATGTSVAVVAETARLLISSGLLREDSDGGLVPARPPEDITLAQVAQLTRASGSERSEGLGTDPLSQAIAMAFLQAERAGDEGLARMSLGALAEPLVAVAPKA